MKITTKNIKTSVYRCNSRLINMMRCFIVLLFFLGATIVSNGQYRLDEEISFMYINGTSTLHDWVVTVGQIKGKLKAEVENNHITKIDSAKIVIPVTSLKSGKKAMDKNLYEALKLDQFKEISYQIKQHTVHNGEMTVKGKLTIAGVTKLIKTKVKQESVGKHIKIRGEIDINMTTFGIIPPKFLYGVFKTGDKIVLQFYFMFCDNN